MNVPRCQAFIDRAVNRLIEQVNAHEFGEINEATLQHHLAMNIHLDALRNECRGISMTLEKKVRQTDGKRFPKKNSESANIDIYLEMHDSRFRCAVEMKCFLKSNAREPNNRYDAYADLANLEDYLLEHADLGYLVLFTDHPHYFDPNFKEHSIQTGDFCLRQGHIYKAKSELKYDTAKPYGPPITLMCDYEFSWRNIDQSWRVLVVKVEGN